MEARRNKIEYQLFNNQSKDRFKIPHYYTNVGLIIAPLSSIFLRIIARVITIDPIYIFSSDLSIFVLAAIVLASNYSDKIKKYNHIIYFIYLTIITIIVWVSFNNSSFQTTDFLSFLVLFFICNTFFQKHQFYIIYALINITLLGFSFIYHPEQSEYILFMLLSILFCSIGNIIMLYLRSKIIEKHKNYSTYLSRVLNHPGIGYALITIEKNEIIIKDNNNSIYQLLGIEKNEELKELIEKGLDNRLINLLKQHQKQTYLIEKDKRLYEIHIDDIEIRPFDYYLVRIYDVSEERKQEKITIQREKKYKNLLEKNVAGVFSTTIEGKIIEINEGLSSIFLNAGLKNEELENLFSFSKKTWVEIKKEVTLINESAAFKLDFLLPKTTITLSMRLFFDKETKLYEGTAIDITAIEKAKQITEEKEQQYLRLFQESNEAILISQKGVVSEVNNSGKELFNDNNLIGKNIWDFTSSKERQKELQLKYIQNTEKPQKFFFDWELARKDGKIIQTELSTSIFLKNNQAVEQTIIRDVTERRAKEESIKNNQKMLRNILENIPEGIIVFDKVKVIFVNSEAFRLLNIKDKEAQDISINKLFKGTSKQIFQNAVHEYFKTGKDFTSQLSLNENTIVEYSIVSTYFNGEQHSVLILKDITHINRLETERLRAELAEQSSKELQEEIIERRKVEQKLEEQSIRMKAIIENSSNTLIWTVDKDYNLVSFNSQFRNQMMLFLPFELEAGINFIDVLKHAMRPEGIKETTETFKKVFKGKSQVIEGALNIKNYNYWFETFLNPIPDTEGNIIEISCVSHNVTEKKENNKEILNSLREKEVLLKEVHHRVKNNLQVISSILNLQSSHIKDEKVLSVLDESQNRIKSMSLIHENLYQTNDFASVNFSEYIKNLVKNLIHSYQVYDIKINLIFDFKDIKLDLDHAIPCGLIVNEIVSNTLKYAFIGRKEGSIFLSIKKQKNTYYLEIGDDGIGLPNGIDIENTETLGLQLVCSLVEQINGTLKLKDEKGTRYLIIFES